MNVDKMQESTEMGATLKYFHILNLLVYYLFPPVLCVSIIFLFFYPEKLQLTSVTAFEVMNSLVLFISSVYINKNIKNRSESIPKKIVLILSAEFFFIICIELASFFWVEINYETILWSSFYYIIWVWFFVFSKEVKRIYNQE